jgi:imidazoleglycerol-phosphate dehydratase
MRTATIKRSTSETSIEVSVNLDGTGVYDVATGVGFFDHMLEQLSRHSLIDLTVRTQGDLHIDAHHTVEDTALALGAAVAQALGDKRGIRRYGDALSPMDEVLTRVAWRAPFSQPSLGTMDTELFEHFFHSFAQTAGITLHVELLHGHNNHHIAESAFKGLARALRTATEVDPRKADAIPSTKGVL